ncbi:MAG: condensation domain-containing protein, partial [Ferruginibacter sp.]
KYLVGYIVPSGLYNADLLATYLKEKLPAYMIPAFWVELELLPLTPNGKIDRKALPEPDLNSVSNHQYIAPRNEREEKLAAIWQRILHLEQIGITDNFFERGGHSLLAMRLISAIRKELRVEMAVKDLFRHPTISEFSGFLENQQNISISFIEVERNRPEMIPLSFSQERLWFIDQLEGSLQFNSPSVLRLRGSLSTESLRQSLQQIIRRHEVLRTVIREQEGIVYQQVQPADCWELSVSDVSGHAADPKWLQARIRELVSAPFDLSKDYMLRGDLLVLSAEEHVLVVTMHHIASDAWSIPVIVQEVVELYSSFEEGRESRLAPLELQYADYALWQRRYLQGETLEKKISYWKNKLDGQLPLQLPTDYPRPAVRSTRGASSSLRLAKDLSLGLQELSHQQGSTLFMTLLSAFKVLLYRYSGGQDISVGSSIANRPQQELEGLIGFFVNTLSLRDEVNGTDTFTDLLQRVKLTTLEAYEHQEVPFEKVVETVVKERDPSRSPLFQVMLVLLNTPAASRLGLGEVELIQEPFESNISKFDITFFITDTPQGLSVSVEYSTDLYRRETIGKMLDHFRQLLSSIVSTPAEKVGKLTMLSAAEREQLLEDFGKAS